MVLAAFIGWGCAAARITRVAQVERDWALCATWGMAVVLALGGALALFRLANRPALAVVAIIGCGFAIAWFRPRGWDWGLALILGITLALFYAPAVASRASEPYDDFLAYFPYARRFLDTGTLLEPFGLRRLTTYGGQSLLHALSIAVGSEKNMNLLDCGIAMLILGGLVYGMLRGYLRQPAAVAWTLAVLMVPIVRHNTMSQATGIVIWLALYRTVQTRAVVLAGLLLAALCTLRSNYVLCSGILMAALLLPLARRFLPLRDWWRLAAVACGAIVPWSLLLYQSSGSLFYPLFAGFQRPGYSYSAGIGWADRMHALFGLLTDPNVLLLVVPLAAATFLIRGAHVPFSAAALATSLLVAFYLASADRSSAFRYVQPIAFGSLLIASTAVVRSKRIAILLGCLMCPVLASYAITTAKERASALASLPAQIADRGAPFPGQIDDYRCLESALPRGASVYTILPLPSLLDYRGRRIFNADFIGCASPRPGMPFFKGPTEVKRYLSSLGIEYIAYNHFNRPAVETGYWRWWWRERAAALNPVMGPMVPYVLDLMDNVDRLATTEEVMYRSNDLTLLHLRRSTTAFVAP
ncbi:MAG: hypothetical protein DMF60_15055 [Acidobacteria bacterium]|nr:MAG: hypothetical protein DMF60_15055 [Acidobacteriota bacterium]